MIKFFLEQDTSELTEPQKQHIIDRLASSQYEPFHLDCKHTKKKLCYCQANSHCNLTHEQKRQLGDFYKQFKPTTTVTQDPANNVCQQRLAQYKKRIRNMQPHDVAAFLTRVKQVNQDKSRHHLHIE